MVSLFDLISTRTFSSIWYWVLIALVWTRLGSVVMGVPVDLIERARVDADAREDARALAVIHGARLGHGGPLGLGLAAFVISGLIVLGWGYGFELAQGVLILILPPMIAQVMTLRMRARIADAPDQWLKHLGRLRWQLYAMILFALVVAALWGMYQALSLTSFR